MEKSTVKKIAVLGAESTGKSELCEALASHYNTVWVEEYARAYFNHSDIYNYTLRDLEIIAGKQMELEDEGIKAATRFLFCDTNLITLKIWADLEFGTCPDSIRSAMNQRIYDFFLLTNNDVPWQPDSQRQNKFSRELIFELNKKEADISKVPYAIVTGHGRQRVTNAIHLIDDLFTRQN